MPHRIVSFFTLIALTLCLSLPAFAQESAAANTKEQDIRQLLVLTKANEMGDHVIAQMSAMMQQANPNISAEFMALFREEADTTELTELIVPIYDRHFSHEDIKGLIAFYKSPVGKKLISVQNQIVAESMQAGERWGQDIARRVLERMNAAE